MTPFHRHVVEMILTMVLPFGVFFLIARVALPAAGYILPIAIMLPSALAVMVVPMSAWMRHRHHTRRDVVEMNVAMFAGMLVVIPLARFMFPAMLSGPERFLPVMLVAMTLPMVGLMYARRGRDVHAAHGVKG